MTFHTFSQNIPLIMLVKLEDPFLLSKAIELISEIVTEVRIKINTMSSVN